MSQGMAVQIVGIGIERALSSKSPATRGAVLGAYGMGSTVGVLLPYSRKHEYEADMVGTRLMARAGYDPIEAVRVWERMKALGGKHPPEFLSTHPATEKRIAELKGIQAEMRPLYDRAPEQHGAGDMLVPGG